MAATELGAIRICVVTGGGPEAWSIINHLADRGAALCVIVEKREPKRVMLRRRLRVCGPRAAAGQLITMCALSAARILFAPRILEVFERGGADIRRRQDYAVIEVETVNSLEAASAIDRLSPHVVLSMGCRLISRSSIDRIAAPLLNLHPAILPQYRGHHGGYWALASGDGGNFGCTVHFVDSGADTGTIVRQVRGRPLPGDTILTYHARLAILAAPLAVLAVKEVVERRVPHCPDIRPSGAHRYQPSPMQYLKSGFKRGVW